MGKSRKFKGTLAAAIATAAAALAVSLGTAAALAGVSSPAKPRPQILDTATRYSAAVKQLGQSAVNRSTGLTGTNQIAALAADDTAWLDQTGALYFVEPTAPADVRAGVKNEPDNQTTSQVLAAASQFVGANISTDDAFSLNSRPGSKKTIYIDFDGMTLTGTGWNGNYGLPASKDVLPYDIDGNTASFSVEERARIISIWQRVAEDYSMFDINVTTADPGQAAIERVDSQDDVYGSRAIVTSMNDTIALSTNLGGCGCGGIAYVGTFDQTGTGAYGHEYYQPAFAFQQGVGGSAKNLAEVVTHEVGHNLGLSHDGTTALDPTGAKGYYSGKGVWAPIMGVGYYLPLTQWSAGEYQYANNTQDDFAVMLTNGASFISDDYSDTSSGARTLLPGAISFDGQISTRSDVDYFDFTTSGGTLDVTVSVAQSSPNLDAELSLFDSSGNLIETANPASSLQDADVALGLNASISRVLASGTYYLRVDGVGAGDPLVDGYSDYSSLGRYRLAGTVPQAVPPTITSLSATEAIVGDTITVTGTGLDSATSLTLGGVSQSFTIVSPTQVSFVIPVGSTGGSVSITNPAGTVTSTSSISVYVGRASSTLSLLNISSPNDRAGDVLAANLTTVTPSDAQVDYQWVRGSTDIANATTNRYTLSSDDLGQKISVRVLLSKTGWLSKTLTSTQTKTVSGGHFTAPTTLTASGTTKVGETLTAQVDAAPNPDPTLLTYQWIDVTSQTTLQNGASNQYVLTNSEAGHIIKVVATFGRDYYDNLVLTSANTELVTGGTLLAVLKAPVGTVAINQWLSLPTITWNTTGVTAEVQWLRDGIAVASATPSLYKISAADVGHKISYRITASKTGFNTGTITSIATIEVPIGTFTAPDLFFNDANQVGQVLVATITDPTEAANRTCSWKAGTSVVSSSCANVTLTRGMAGLTMSLTVNWTLTGYESKTLVATGSQPVSGASFVPTGLSLDSSKAYYGGELKVPAFNSDGAAVGYSWWRGDVELVSARGSANYMPTIDDIDQTITVVVELSGQYYLTQTQSFSAVVTAPPQTLGSVTLSGVARAGQTLTATATGFSLVGTELSYQWLADGTPIFDATAETYDLTEYDLGSLISVEVTSAVPGYLDRTVTAATAAEISGGQNSSGTVAITGTAKVGKILKAKLALWVDGTTFKYQWLRSGKNISRATKSSYKLTSADRNKLVTLKITATAAFYDSRTIKSKATSKIK